ncbi:17020_t:CDS:2, partial [Cetraspora pellucida]
MGLTHSSSYHISHVRSVSTSGPVVVEPFSDIYPRLDIWDFCDNEAYAPQLDLLVQSYQALYDRPYYDMRSFYQVAGIHGLPFEPYDGVTGGAHEYKNETDWQEGRFGGYCHHGSVLFPTWHRPYMLLIESLLVNEAQQIAYQYPDNEKEKYIEASKQLRHPYWDWADNKTMNGIPKVFLTPEIEINTPKGKKKVKNPLKSFTLPVDLAHPLRKGNNPTDKPNYTPPDLRNNPYTPAGYPTIRYPNNIYKDQYDLLVGNVSSHVATVFKPGWYQTFHFGDFLRFSSHGVRPDDSQMPNRFSGHPLPTVINGSGHFASLEITHDAFHLLFGGLGGHMTYVDLASFEPVFFFHHSNMDRLFALWQGAFPDSWIPKKPNINGTYTELINEELDENSDLTPFRKTKTEFWKSSDVRDFEKLGYTYLEWQKLKSQGPKKIQSYLLELYKPDPHCEERFFVKVIIEPGKLAGPYAIRVFIDLPTANIHTPTTSPHFAGLVAMWSGNKAHDDSFVVGTVDITAAMKRLGIRAQTYESINEINTTTGLLRPAAIFDVYSDIQLIPVLQNNECISPKEAGVVSIEVYSFKHSKVDPNFLVEDT